MRVCEPVLLPYLTGPEKPVGIEVLSEVTEDVCLLEEGAHAVGEDELVGDVGGFFARGGKEAGEAFADETSHVVAVEVVFLPGGDAVMA